MIVIAPVSRLGVRDVWAQIVPGIEEMYAQHRGPWMPEDVYSELLGGRVTLFLMQRNNVTKGFFVARQTAEIDGIVLFIWLMWAEPHAFEFDEVLPAIDKLAQESGAKRIRHESPREGWAKKGFELTMHVFEREVIPHVPDTP